MTLILNCFFLAEYFICHTKFTKHTKARIVNSRVPPDAYTRCNRQVASEAMQPFREVRGFCGFRVRQFYIKVPPQNDHLSLV